MYVFIKDCIAGISDEKQQGNVFKLACLLLTCSYCFYYFIEEVNVSICKPSE